MVDRHYFQGQEIRNLRLTFDKGRLTDMTADSGLDPLKRLYNASGEGKDLFGAVDIGINPAIRIPRDNRLRPWMASGMVTVGVGANAWAGGDNECDFALFMHKPNATLAVDDKPLVENGTLRQ